jgi:hypothetical protein
MAEPPFLKPLLAKSAIGDHQCALTFLWELVTGISHDPLCSSPFMLWWIPAGHPVADTRSVGRRGGSADSGLQAVVASWGLGPWQGGFLLSVFVLTARYLLDLSPLLIVLAGLGAWIAYGSAATRSARILVGGATLTTALVSAGVSILLAFNNWLT